MEWVNNLIHGVRSDDDLQYSKLPRNVRHP